MHDLIEYPLVTRTTNFQFFAKLVLGQDGRGVAAALADTCEKDFAALTTLFSCGVPRALPFRIFVDDLDSGARHSGCADTEIYVGFNKPLRARFPDQKMLDIYRVLLAAEVTEVFESLTQQWTCTYSPGEALSRAIALNLHPSGEFSPTAPKWLDSARRPNWIDSSYPRDTDDISVGCSVLFLNWLRHVLGYQWAAIIAADRPTLAQIYTALTGSTDAWEVFSTQMAVRWEIGKACHLFTDQPF